MKLAVAVKIAERTEIHAVGNLSDSHVGILDELPQECRGGAVDVVADACAGDATDSVAKIFYRDVELVGIPRGLAVGQWLPFAHHGNEMGDDIACTGGLLSNAVTAGMDVKDVINHRAQQAPYHLAIKKMIGIAESVGNDSKIVMNSLHVGPGHVHNGVSGERNAAGNTVIVGREEAVKKITRSDDVFTLKIVAHNDIGNSVGIGHDRHLIWPESKIVFKVMERRASGGTQAMDTAVIE